MFIRLPSSPWALASRALVIATVAALALSGCGRRGALEPPPDPTAVKAAPADASVRPQVRSKPKPIVTPQGDFFLDPLLK